MSKRSLMRVVKLQAEGMVELSEKDYAKIVNDVWSKIEEIYNENEDIEIYDMHNIVEAVLEEDFPVSC